MSKKDNRSPEEIDREYYNKLKEARLNSPITRFELIEAIKNVANYHSANCDIVSAAMNKLADELS
jgi:hypothetical protein